MIQLITARNVAQRRRSLIALLVFAGAVSGCATQSVDPLEGLNRGVFAVNRTADRFLFRPIAIGYSAVLPKPVELGVTNVYSNVLDPWVSVNQLLQGKPRLALRDASRFLLNTTIGIAGIFDVAGRMGFEKHHEDFGQTLAVWGFGQGPYLVLPLFGPSNPRDVFRLVVGRYAYLPLYIDHVPTRNVVLGLDFVSRRAKLLNTERLIKGDRYLFVRDAYLQRREYLIKDGVVADSFLDDDE